MLNGNSGSEIVPHPHTGVPDLQGVQSEVQARIVVEKPSEAIMPSVIELQGPQIFVNTPWYEWHLEVHVQGLDEDSRKQTMAIEGLFHHFGVMTKAHEQELQQHLVGS